MSALAGSGMHAGQVVGWQEEPSLLMEIREDLT